MLLANRAAVRLHFVACALSLIVTAHASSSSAAVNPYNFYSSVAQCAAAEKLRCEACLPGSSCQPIIAGDDGNAECSQLAANQGRGYSLVCINLALAIDTVSSCTAAAAPGCPRDTHASESIATLANNAVFLDDSTCSAPLDRCLGSVFSPSSPSDPAPSMDTSCDADSSSCDGSCDDSSDGGGDGCSSSDNSSGCDGSSSDSSGCDGSCDDSGESSCDSGGDGCSGDSGGDCSGGGGDCSGGGGDCSGGGGDCNASARHHHSGMPIEALWALLPIPFARRVKLRAVRKRAREAETP